VFAMSPAGAVTSLYSFSGGADGKSPYGGLEIGADGNLYGTTYEGGANESFGRIFRMTPGGLLTTIASFAGSNGAHPWASLTRDADGSFLGVTDQGGISGNGVIFRVTSNGDLSTVHAFARTSGAHPDSSRLVRSANGAFSGTTVDGGEGDRGVVYQLVPSSGQTITFEPLLDKTYGDTPFVVAASASSGLPVTFSASGSCSVSGDVVTIASGGICQITASQPGDGNYPAAENVTRQFDVAYTWSNVLQPINVDGSSIFKLGSTVPVKFQLTGASAAIANLPATIYVARVSDTIVGVEFEPISTSAADTGNTFRYTAGQYIFNLSTKALAEGAWQIRVDLHDEAPVAHTLVISVKK
jgi:uncharacterized repeat protein (TIGR03803 family)